MSPSKKATPDDRDVSTTKGKPGPAPITKAKKRAKSTVPKKTKKSARYSPHIR